MGRGQWTRWGRGMCEGWSLEIGMAFRGSVVRRDTSGQPTTWIASINSTGLGEFLEREIAMGRVEEVVECSMVLAFGPNLQAIDVRHWTQAHRRGREEAFIGTICVVEIQISLAHGDLLLTGQINHSLAADSG